MSPKIHNQIARSKEQALAAFVVKKAEIDQMLVRLQELSGDHFGYSPDEVTWAHVGTLEHYAELLKRITDSAFREGEARGIATPISRSRPDRVRPAGLEAIGVRLCSPKAEIIHDQAQ
jgi:hypothetical protein